MSESTKKNVVPDKKRRWFRRILVVFAIFIGLGFVVNGPVARYAIGYYLNQILEQEGMQGSVEVDGSLVGGFTLRNLNYKGDQGIEKIVCESIDVSYTINGLRASSLEFVKVVDFSALVDISKFSAASETSEKTDINKLLDSLRPWIIQSNLSIEDLDLTLKGVIEVPLNIEWNNFRHQAGDQKFELLAMKVVAGNYGTTPIQDSVITWGERSVEIDVLEVFPELAIEGLSFDWDVTPNGSCSLDLLGAKLDVEIDKNASFVLKEGVLQPSEIAKRFGFKLPVLTDVVALDVEVIDWQKNGLPDSEVRLSTVLQDVQWEGYSANSVDLKIEQKARKFALSTRVKVSDVKAGLELSGRWTRAQSEEWWSYATFMAEADVSGGQLFIDKHFSEIIPSEWKGIDLRSSQIAIKASGDLVGMELESLITDVNLSGISLDSVYLPKLRASLQTKQMKEFTGELGLGSEADAEIKGNYSYSIADGSYIGSLDIDKTGLDWVNLLVSKYLDRFEVKDGMEMSWNGSGKINPEGLNQSIHAGSLNVKKLVFNYDTSPQTNLSLLASYQWPKSIELKSLRASQGDWQVDLAFDWDGERVSLHQSKLTEQGKALSSVKGSFPFTNSIDSLESFLRQKQRWDIQIDSEVLPIPRLAQFIPSKHLTGITGSVKTDLKLSGSPSIPNLSGYLKVDALRGIADKEVDAISFDTRLQSTEWLLNITGKLFEEKAKRLDFELELPFEFHKWVLNPQEVSGSLKKSEVRGSATLEKLPLERFKQFIPEVDVLKGTLDAKMSLSGTIGDPNYTVDLHAHLPLIELKSDSIGDIRDLHFNFTVDDKKKVLGDLKAMINGGKLAASYSVDLTDFKDPLFEANLKLEHALVHRDDLMVIRTNGNLKIKGKFDDATIFGEVALVESLFYKDIELIPIGVPSSAVKAVELPSLTPFGLADELPVPKPFANWKLDVIVKTKDPIMMRGNVGRGQVEGSIKVKGVLKKPELDGTLFLNKIKAKLPFSVVTIEKGRVTFKPGQGFVPDLDINAKSTIGNYETSLYVYGSAANPKTAFSSYAPLPESEIMSLLVTGTTTAELGNKDVARFKAFQLLLLELEQVAERPGGNALFKELLKSVAKLDMKVGETDDFTGRQFASGSIQLHPRWHLTAQLDETQQTRGLIVYSLRFR